MLESMFHDYTAFLDASNYSDATRSSYEWCLKCLDAWVDEHSLDPASLYPSDFKRFLDCHEWGNNMRRLVSNATKSFVRWRYGSSHPVLAFKAPRDDAPPQRTLSAEQVDCLLPTFDTTKPIGWRNLSIISLILETGLRETEVCNLLLENLDLAGQGVHALTKGSKWRHCVFSAITASYLDIWLDARRRYVRIGVKTLFVSVSGLTQGHPLTPGGLRAIFRRMAHKAGLPALSPHDLRRTMACLYSQAGLPDRTIMLLGGWKSIGTFIRYTRTLQPRVEDVERFSPVVKSMELET